MNPKLGVRQSQFETLSGTEARSKVGVTCTWCGVPQVAH